MDQMPFVKVIFVALNALLPQKLEFSQLLNNGKKKIHFCLSVTNLFVRVFNQIYCISCLSYYYSRLEYWMSFPFVVPALFHLKQLDDKLSIFHPCPSHLNLLLSDVMITCFVRGCNCQLFVFTFLHDKKIQQLSSRS